MYKKEIQLTFEDFVFPFGELDSENEWVKLAGLVPWETVEREYAKQFVDNGHPAHSARIALGALIIKQRLKCSDEWTVRHVSENAYLQFFLGMKAYSSKAPFGASTMVEFRKRFPPEAVAAILEASIPKKDRKDHDDPAKPGGKGEQEAGKTEPETPPNSGTLLMDATCCPADIAFPQDFQLLNHARELLEDIVREISKAHGWKTPRMYSKSARKSFLNLSNEWYARDSSRKVRSALQAKARNGEYTGSYPPFGYCKDPMDRHHLIPSEYASVVKRMFQMALEGQTCYAIARKLEKEQVPTPRASLMQAYGKYETAERAKYPNKWDKTTVHGILRNPIYLGKLVWQKTQTKSFKDKHVVARPEKEWITVEGTHEALIDQATFDTVQQRIQVKQPVLALNPENMLRGLLFCGGCNTRMAFSAASGRQTCGRYSCSKHRRYGGKECSSHYITVKQINAVLLEDIQRHASLAAEDKEK